MAQINFQFEQDSPFPVAADRFDQKNEMFKRARWDPKLNSFFVWLDDVLGYGQQKSSKNFWR
jgi:hypothetical protein